MKARTGCKVCGDPKTVHSHLLPKAHMLELKGDDPNITISDKGADRYFISQGGLFDDHILCDAHERVTARLDDFAISFARKIDHKKLPPPPTVTTIGGTNGDTLARFTASVLWRCHVSTTFQTRQINLGPHAERLKSIIFDREDSPLPEAYLYLPITGDLEVREMATLPADKRVGSVRRWSFLIGGVNYLMDLGNGSTNTAKFTINGKTEVPAFVIDFRESGLRDGWLDLASIASRHGYK